MQSFVLSVIALCVSIIALMFNRRAWLQTYRPILTARVATADAGNVAVLYNLVIENTGSRPAKDIQLVVGDNDLKKALNPGCSRAHTEITNCFDSHYSIPVLANGRAVSTAFGTTSCDSESTWIPEARFPITIKYSSLEGKKYKTRVSLFIFDDAGFAGFHYADTK